ncbi:MAG: protease complex subunit PrcB family protein [Candidatus Binatia bacterium]
MPFVTVDKGFNSGVRGRKLLALKTEKEWRELWETHESITTPPKPVPLVDFEREMIVVAFSGEKPSGGHGIAIVKIEEDTAKRELRVTFRETRPPAGAMVTGALTQPYHIVKLKTTDLPVTFVSQQ